MKKILIVSHALELGGAERSLIGLLDAIDKKEYKVDLFLLRHEGELLSFIPEGVNLLPEIPAYTVLACPMDIQIVEYHLSIAINIHIALCRRYSRMRSMIWQLVS